MRAATQQKHGGVPQAQTLAMGFDFSQTGIELPMSFMGGNSTQTLTQSQAQTGPSQAQQTFSVSRSVNFPFTVCKEFLLVTATKLLYDTPLATQRPFTARQFSYPLP